MSIDALSWAFNLELPNSGVKLTLLALANYANDEGEAYPNQKSISKKTCLSTRAIRTHLVVLEELGLITRKSRKRDDGTFTSDLFQINIGATPLSIKTSGKNSQRKNQPTAKSSKIQRKNFPTPAADSARHDPSLTSIITKNDPSLFPEDDFAPDESGALEKKKALTDDAWEAYNTAHFNRYGVDSIRDAKANSCLRDLIACVGKKEAPHIAAFFVSLNKKLYLESHHDIGLLKRDAKGIRTQWATGRIMTSTKAAQLDGTATNADAVKEAMEIWKRRNGHANV